MKQFTNHQLWLWYNDMEKCKWTDIYDTEQELIGDLIRLGDENYRKTGKPNGYGYLESFQRQLKNGKELSPKQITQLKRLAKSVAFMLYAN